MPCQDKEHCLICRARTKSATTGSPEPEQATGWPCPAAASSLEVGRETPPVRPEDLFPRTGYGARGARERDDAGMSAVSGASPDAAPSGAVRAVELAIRGDRTSCAATVEKKLIKLAEGPLAAAVLAGCGTPQAPVTPGVVKVAAGENFRGEHRGAGRRPSCPGHLDPVQPRRRPAPV